MMKKEELQLDGLEVGEGRQGSSGEGEKKIVITLMQVRNRRAPRGMEGDPTLVSRALHMFMCAVLMIPSVLYMTCKGLGIWVTSQEPRY